MISSIVLRATTVLFISINLMLHSPVASAAESQKSPSTDANQNIAIVKLFLNEVVNSGRLELVDQLWTRDMVWHGASLGEVSGIDAYRRALQEAVGKSFSGMKLDIKQVIASGDQVVVHFTNSGTNNGAFLGLPATGRFSKWEGIGIYRIADGKIAEAWFVEDILGQQMMLGHWPPATAQP